MGFGKRLKQLRARLNLTLEEVSRRTGLSAPHLSLVERDLRRPTDQTVGLLGKCYGIGSKRLVLEHRLQSVPSDVKRAIEKKAAGATGIAGQSQAPATDNLRRIPVFDVAAGDWIDFDDGGYPAGFADFYICLPIGDPNCFACKVAGDSMCRENGPSFAEGDIIVFSPAARIHNGDYMFVRDEDAGATFKQAFFDKSANTARLCPLNRKYSEKTCKLDRVNMYKMVFHLKRF